MSDPGFKRHVNDVANFLHRGECPGEPVIFIDRRLFHPVETELLEEFCLWGAVKTANDNWRVGR